MTKNITRTVSIDTVEYTYYNVDKDEVITEKNDFVKGTDIKKMLRIMNPQYKLLKYKVLETNDVVYTVPLHKFMEVAVIKKDKEDK